MRRSSAWHLSVGPLAAMLAVVALWNAAPAAGQSAGPAAGGEHLPPPQSAHSPARPAGHGHPARGANHPSAAGCPDCPAHASRQALPQRPSGENGLARRMDWTQAPSTYTHNPYGQRVDQYALGVQPTVAQQTNYQQSGYRHTRSNLAYGGSVDNLHIVEEWGRPVRPYGEWLYPNRPFAVPYSQWGPQPVITPWGVWPGMGGPGWPGGGGPQPAPPGGQPGAGWNWPTTLPGEVDSDWPLGTGE